MHMADARHIVRSQKRGGHFDQSRGCMEHPQQAHNGKAATELKEWG